MGDLTVLLDGGELVLATLQTFYHERGQGGACMICGSHSKARAPCTKHEQMKFLEAQENAATRDELLMARLMALDNGLALAAAVILREAQTYNRRVRVVTKPI